MKLAVYTLNAIAALAFCSAVTPTSAAIYQCEVNGVKTFVDSPRGCPGDGGTRRDAVDTRKPIPAVPSAPATNHAQRSTIETPAANREVPATAASAACQKLYAQDAGQFRECLREERRGEVRKIATARLRGLGAEVDYFATSPQRTDGLIAAQAEGKTTDWCTSILNDLIADKNLDVVDDENSAGPEWMSSGGEAGKPKLQSAAILDPNFQEWIVDGRKVFSGYVTARWRKSNLIVLRVFAACTSVGDGKAKCSSHRIVYVHEATAPKACNVTFVGRAYWGNWKDSMTPINLKASTSAAK